MKHRTGFLALGKIKGGTGATALAVTIATRAHRLHVAASGQYPPVAVLDADPQATAARWLDRIGEGVPVVHVEPGDDPRGATIAAARRALALAPFVVADCPPSALDVLRVLLGACDMAVIPTGPSIEDIYLARKVLEIAADESALLRRSIPAVIVPAGFDTQTRIARDALELLRSMDCPIGPVVARRVAWQEAVSDGRSILDSSNADAAREAQAASDFVLDQFHQDAP